MCYLSTHFAQKYRENTKEVAIYKNITWAIVYCKWILHAGWITGGISASKSRLFLLVSALLSPAHRNFHSFRRGVQTYYSAQTRTAGRNACAAAHASFFPCPFSHSKAIWAVANLYLCSPFVPWRILLRLPLKTKRVEIFQNKAALPTFFFPKAMSQQTVDK